MNAVTWQVERIVRVVDGDTLRLVRARTTLLDDLELTVRDAGPNGALCRLAWVDTPERGQEGYQQARDDLIGWLSHYSFPPFTVVCFESAGWDRILVDLQDADGSSASQWLMAERSWPPYMRGVS